MEKTTTPDAVPAGAGESDPTIAPAIDPVADTALNGTSAAHSVALGLQNETALGNSDQPYDGGILKYIGRGSHGTGPSSSSSSHLG